MSAALHSTVAEEYNKAMVVMLNGLGKTYSAAFFHKSTKKAAYSSPGENFITNLKEFLIELKKPDGLFYKLEKD